MCSKLTYFHSQYVKMYQKAEEAELKRLIEEKDSVPIIAYNFGFLKFMF